MSSATSPNPQRLPALPSALSRATPSLSVEADLTLDWSRDYLRELRLSAAGQLFGLPLSQAHAVAAVSHIDHLIAALAEKESQIQELLNDWIVAEMRSRALAHLLVEKV